MFNNPKSPIIGAVLFVAVFTTLGIMAFTALIDVVLPALHSLAHR